MSKEKRAARKKARRRKRRAQKEAREAKKKVRREKRAELRKVRRSDKTSSQKKAEKKAIREEARKEIRKVKKVKKKTITEIREEKKQSLLVSIGSAPDFVDAIWKKYVTLAHQLKMTNKSELKPGPALATLVKKCSQDLSTAAKIEAGLVKHYRRQQVLKNLLRHPARLECARKSGSLTGTFGRTWICPAPYDQNEVYCEFRKTGGSGKASVTFCKFEPGGKRQVLWVFEVQPGKDNIGQQWSKSFRAVKDCILTAAVDGKSVLRKIEYKIRIRRPSQGKIRSIKKARGRVKGFADIHAHHMVHLAFGGRYVWPDPINAMPRSCGDGTRHGRIWLYGKGDEWRGKHPQRTVRGTHWPDHLDTMHQMMHGTQLREAVDGGLRILVPSMVNNMWVAHLVRTRDENVPLNDMDNIRLQLRMMRAFAKQNRWYQIASDPSEARHSIKKGHLAVIPAIEISHLMPDMHGDWKDQLDELHDLGVRMMQIVHETDSRFAGAALHHGLLFLIKHAIKDVTTKGAVLSALKKARLEWPELSSGELLPLKLAKANPNGLFSEGKELLRELAARSMILEIDHCSRKARAAIFKEVMNPKAPPHLRYYPLNYSHSRIDELMPSEKMLKEEMGESPYEHAPGWDSADDTLEYMPTLKEACYVIPTGGVFGIRTGANAQRWYRASGIANTCHTSTRSLAQIVKMGQDAGLALTLGTDLQGFAPQTGARFKSKRPKAWERVASGLPKQVGEELDDLESKPVRRNGKLSDFNTGGLRHIGLEPDLIQDLDNLGLDVRALRNSAEAFLRMWERCYDRSRTKLSKTEYHKRMVEGVV